MKSNDIKILDDINEKLFGSFRVAMALSMFLSVSIFLILLGDWIFFTIIFITSVFSFYFLFGRIKLLTDDELCFIKNDEYLSMEFKKSLNNKCNKVSLRFLFALYKRINDLELEK